jgi:hypothetical protein
MRALFDLFLAICLLRKGPQDIPASPVLLKLSLLSYGLSGLLVMLVSMTPAAAFFQTLLDITLLTGLTYGILELQGYGARFGQTLTALLGAGTLLALVTLPVIVWIGGQAAQNDAAELPSLLFFLLLGWSIAVMAHILKHALSTTRWMGLLYALVYLIISLALSSLLVAVD